jgi:hypothetical protein
MPHEPTDGEEEKTMQEVIKARVLRCLCGQRLQASHDEALHDVLRGHIEREHSHADVPPEERLKEMVSSAVYGFEYVPIGTQDSLEAEGFGPEPY